VDALVEMWLLARCPMLIYNGISTFTTVACILNDGDQGEQFDIEKIPYFISIIIPLFNFSSEASLKNCLEGFARQTYPKELYEILIVHNGLTEEMKRTICEFEQVQTYFQAATHPNELKNKGLSLGKDEALALIAPEGVPEKSWIENGVRALKSHQSVVFVAG